MRYGWELKGLPERCKCDKFDFSLQHALDCPLGGLRTIQHNEALDLVASMMREVGLNCVEIEPKFLPLTGEVFELKSTNKDDEARADIKCTGLWRRMRHAYFDVKVVSPYARSYAKYNPKALYHFAEQVKIREYAPKIKQLEQADFMPLVFTYCPKDQALIGKASRINE